METLVVYPYQDITTRNFSREIWMDIKKFEGYYQVSNLGRVRSLDRTVPHSRCGTQFVKGRILKQSVKKHYNASMDDHVNILHVTLANECESHYLIVRRLVFFTFKGLDLQDHDDIIINPIDNDGLNCRLNNLEMLTRSEKRYRTLEQNRIDPARINKMPEIVRPNFAIWKPVNRCDTNGKVLQTFPSIASAKKDPGSYNGTYISRAIRSGEPYRGFVWKLASRSVLDELSAQYPKRKKIRQKNIRLASNIL